MTEEIKNTKKVYKKLLPKLDWNNGISVAQKMAESAMILNIFPVKYFLLKFKFSWEYSKTINHL